MSFYGKIKGNFFEKAFLLRLSEKTLYKIEIAERLYNSNVKLKKPKYKYIAPEQDQIGAIAYRTLKKPNGQACVT